MRYYMYLLAIAALAGFASAQWGGNDTTVCYNGMMWDDCGQTCNRSCLNPAPCSEGWCGAGQCQCPGYMIWDPYMYMCVDQYNCSKSASSCPYCANGCDAYGNCYHNNTSGGGGDCAQGYYGYGCGMKCSEYCQGGMCGSYGNCSEGCTYGHYGPYSGCNSTCSDGCEYSSCDGNTGACLAGCVEGKHGLWCDQVCTIGCKLQSCSSDGGCWDECDTTYPYYEGCDMCNECDYNFPCEGTECMLPGSARRQGAAITGTIAAVLLGACLLF